MENIKTYNRTDLIELVLSKYTNENKELDLFSLIETNEDISLIASILAPDLKSEPIWTNFRRDIIEAGINSCIRKGLRTNKELSRILKLSVKEMRKEFSFVIEADGKKERKAYIKCERAFNHLSKKEQSEIFLASAYTCFETIHTIAKN